MKPLREKPFVVIDLGSGSYIQENEGHEKYNEIRNPVTGRYYGYAPPHGNLNIQSLGAKKTESSVSDVLVIYVKKAEDSNDRVISSFIESATIYANPKENFELRRTAKRAGKVVHCSYCVESEDLIDVDEISGSNSFTIRIKDYSTSMFRHQRFYKGKYPELDKLILDYLESLYTDDREIDDTNFQENLQKAIEIPSKLAKNHSKEEPQYFESPNGRQVKKKIGISKAALANAEYECEVNTDHKTFDNKMGKPYMEGHHLIPCSPKNARYFWNRFHVNIDCMENIVCICPTCHRNLHYGSRISRHHMLEILYRKRKTILEELGINLTIKELESFYD